MTAEEELAPLLSSLRSAQVLPFLEQLLPSTGVTWRRMPDEMADVLATSPDFRPPSPGSPPVWLQLEGEGDGHAVVIVTRPAADGELWVIAPRKG